MKRSVSPLLAGTLLGASALLPLGAGPATAAEKEPAFSGYSSSAWSSPLELEIYEPTIPLPATPQAELLFGYTVVEADTTSTKGRSSYLWPGDPVGEGAKTIVENMPLPEQLRDPIAAQGYPFQVNSGHPSGEPTDKDEPFPGLVMRTTAGEGRVSASTGFSSDCDVQAPKSNDGGGGVPQPPGGGLPELPDLPGTGGLDALSSGVQELGDSLSKEPRGGKQAKSDRRRSAQASAEEEAGCEIPKELTALVDLGGYATKSQSVADEKQVVATSRAALGDVALIGGIVTMSGITSTSVAGSNGAKGDAAGKAAIGTVTIAGTPFTLGPEGFEAAGQKQTIPGLPDEATAALKQLGITITLPKPERKVEGDMATTTLTAARVELDLTILRPALQQIPLGRVLDAIPFPPGSEQLKNALGAANQIAPRYVFNFGTSNAVVDTVQAIEFPDTDPVVPDGDGDGDADGGATGNTGGGGTPAGGTGTTGSGTGTAGSPSASSPGAAGSGGAPTAGTLPPNAPAAGLPPLFSIPGMILLGGIALAAAAGSYLRKIGALALGGGASCAHGLDSGLPDLRKA